MSSFLLPFSSHSRPSAKPPVMFLDLKPPLDPPTEPPSPLMPPKLPDPQIRFSSDEFFAQSPLYTFSSLFHAHLPIPSLDLLPLRAILLMVSMAQFCESSSGLFITLGCPLTTLCRLSLVVSNAPSCSGQSSLAPFSDHLRRFITRLKLPPLLCHRSAPFTAGNLGSHSFLSPLT